jgi:two-component system response regulator (stage 0 sporulation protein F)
MNILIIDDQPNILRVTSIALKLLGCRPFTASTTGEALQLLEAEKIDGVFLDVNLGGESGLVFLAQLLKIPGGPSVMLSTALNRDEAAFEATRHGALGCLVKPFSMDDIRDAIKKIQNHQRQRNKGAAIL